MTAAEALHFYQQVMPLVSMLVVYALGVAACTYIQRVLRRMRGKRRI